MCPQAVRCLDDVGWRPDLDLARELLRLVAVDVPDDLLQGSAGAPWTGPQLGGGPGSDVIERRPARLQELQTPLEVVVRKHDSLQVRGHVGDTPEVGRA